MAGGLFGINNFGYYLYNGQDYWTLTPSFFSGVLAFMVYITPNGRITNHRANTILGIRPVINLKADTKFTVKETDEKGSLTNPYIVS